MTTPAKRIIIGETGPDWRPRPAERFYAQFEGEYDNGGGTFEFGATPQEAVRNLITKHDKIKLWFSPL